MLPCGLYLHIPFCLHKCPYCDFNTYALASIPERDYVAALLAELDYRASLPAWKGRKIKTVYFGGGTPSLLSAASISNIVNAVRGTFSLEPSAEISLEANPGSIAFETMAGYREAGINRLSLGAQSFAPEVLRTLGRIHTPEQTESAVHTARSAGFSNLSFDLIYGVPNQSAADLRADLAAAANLAPDHLSAYGLTLEKGTPFYVSYQKGLLRPPPEETVIEMMQEINLNVPAKMGLHRYEISNFARPGMEARHNLAYWDGEEYLGLGAGAHSFCRFLNANGTLVRRRWSNYALPDKYMNDCAATGRAESWEDVLSTKDSIFEFFFLGLRKTAGISLHAFRRRFGYSVQELYPARLEILSDQGLITLSGDSLALTERGLLVADSVIEEFVEPERAIEREETYPPGELPSEQVIAANS